MPARIVVIEDNEDNITLVDYLLRAHGYDPMLARNGQDGLRITELERPDLILLDIQMKGMDGYEVVASIRAHPELKDTRVVAVTASAMVGDRERIAAGGFDGYIQKPIEPRTFAASVERFLAL